MNAPYCCHEGCKAAADYSIWWSAEPDPYTSTHSCEAHAGALLGYSTDVPKEEWNGTHWRVYPIGGEIEDTSPDLGCKLLGRVAADVGSAPEHPKG